MCWTGIELAWTPDPLHRVGNHLVPLGNPARRARNGEQNGEHGCGEAHRFQNDARIEIYIWIQLFIYEILILEGHILKSVSYTHLTLPTILRV